MSTENTVFELPEKVTITWDDESGITAAALEGFWTMDDAKAFYPPMVQAAERSRRRNRHARLLFDVTESKVQSDAMMEHSGKDALIVPSDRVAVVVQSTLLKLQMQRRKQLPDDIRYFTDRAEAKEWLRR